MSDTKDEQPTETPTAAESSSTAHQAEPEVDAPEVETQVRAAAPVSKTQEAHIHYLKRFQIWDNKEDKWLPYDPSGVDSLPPPQPDDYNYFYLNMRWKHPLGEPVYVLSNWSEPLLGFLRSFIGGDFFDSDPEWDMPDFFSYLVVMKVKFDVIKNACNEELDVKERCETAKGMGCRDVDDDDTPDKAIRSALMTLHEHLTILIDCIDDQFRPLAERLELLISHNMMDFGLLIYFFQVGDDIVGKDDSDQEIAFRCTRRSYHNDGRTISFQISGKAWHWFGDAYSQHDVWERVDKFEGTLPFSGLPILHMKTEHRTRLEERGRKYVSLSGIHYKLYRNERIIVDRYAHNNESRVAWFNEDAGYDTRDTNAPLPSLDESLLYLLPSQVHGFNLVKKKWSKFFVKEIGEVHFDDNAWDHLVLDPDVKELIQGLVDSTRTKTSSTRLINDVISGKGGGLIAVLHGPPGTGKTLTAEAVADYLHRPLYMVGSSQLTTNSSDMESNLKSILRLATAWDAVLLIDEADVFLEQRSLHELERNQLVSVALRTLEYHRGVLFLTTNRIKTFDDAFLSRFSIAIRYPNLNKAGRATIWKKFFELGKCEISEADIEKLAEKKFNGRTIKNLVRTAQSLALSKNATMSVKHVHTVVRAQEKFLTDFAGNLDEDED